MRNKKTVPSGSRLNEVLAEAQRDRDKRAGLYRDRALRLFPHICGRCGREFDGKRLRELTVHHKDHNHDNNPPDGSNWELLCIYCHDMEHQRYLEADDPDSGSRGNERDPSSAYKPFAGLKDLLAGKK
jgi:hypothetical protein